MEPILLVIGTAFIIVSIASQVKTYIEEENELEKNIEMFPLVQYQTDYGPIET